MEIKRSGSQPSGKGPADYFTGAVRIDPLFEAPEPARVRGASVTFEPGARTAWHTHPLGQTLIVMWGVGLVQHWGGAIEEIWPGDAIWFSPGEKHWHGATPTTSMTHIEALNGKVGVLERRKAVIRLDLGLTTQNSASGCSRRAKCTRACTLSFANPS